MSKLRAREESKDHDGKREEKKRKISKFEKSVDKLRDLSELVPTAHELSWYKCGREICVADLMCETGYKYKLESEPGCGFDPKFEPELTPEEMLRRGVFEGKYLNDCISEFPREWFQAMIRSGTTSPEGSNPAINEFGIKSRLNLKEWQAKGWIPIIDGDPDVRGWFQWYCRYWLGRRIPELDTKQISRWRSFRRHRGAIQKSEREMDLVDAPHSLKKQHRPRQRQALLQWAYDPFV